MGAGWMRRLLAVSVSLGMMFGVMAAELVLAEDAGAVARIGETEYQTIGEALAACEDGATVELLRDTGYKTNGSGLWNITRSITIDGNGHTINGWGARGTNKTTFAINNGGMRPVDVVFKNLTIINAGYEATPIETRGNIGSLTLDNCTVKATSAGINYALTIGGNQSTAADINIISSTLEGEANGCAVRTYNPVRMNIKGSRLTGSCALRLSGPSSSAGSGGSVISIRDSLVTTTDDSLTADEVVTLETDGVSIKWDNTRVNPKEDISSQYEIIATSQVGHVTGGGVYRHGELARLEAEELDGYSWDGWYRDDVLITSELVLELEVTGSGTYTARYSPAADAVTVRATAVGGGSVDRGSVTAAPGSTVTIAATADDGMKLVYWVDLRGNVLSMKPVLELSVYKDMEVQAVFDECGSAVVTYVDENGCILGARLYTASSVAAMTRLVAPSRMGCDFVGWRAAERMTYRIEGNHEITLNAGDAIDDRQALYILRSYAASGRNIVFRSGYLASGQYAIKVYAVINGRLEEKPYIDVLRPVGKAATVTVEKSFGGTFGAAIPFEKITCDYMDNEKIGSARSFTINPAAGSYVYYAYYTDGKGADSDRMGTLSLNPATSSYTNSPKLDLVMCWNLPERAQVLEAGLYYHSLESNVLSHLKTRRTVTGCQSTGTLIAHLDVTGRLDTALYVQAMVRYRLPGDEADRYMYSAVTGTRSFLLEAPCSDTGAYKTPSYDELRGGGQDD